MRVAVLASGSEGNATLVESGGTRLLVDAGIGPFALRCALERARLGAGLGRARREQPVDAVVVTHAHADHFGFARKYAKKMRIPVYVTEATARAHDLPREGRFRMFGPRDPFEVGELLVSPVPVPHDAPQVAVSISDGQRRVAVVTDVGEVTGRLADHLALCDVLLVESNHDAEMLERGPYPAFIKRRVASAGGHLSNAQTHELLARLPLRTRTVVLMHLSRTNNHVPLALECARDALAGRRVNLYAAPPRELLMVDADAPAPLPIPGGAPRSERKRPLVLPGQLSFWPGWR